MSGRLFVLFILLLIIVLPISIWLAVKDYKLKKYAVDTYKEVHKDKK